MSFSVTMPALGESVSEGTVTRWLKQEGDHVDVDEPLLEVSTDKVDTEIPSPTAGVLQRIVVSEDETVDVGAELAVIGDSADGGQQDGGEQPAGEQSEDQSGEQSADAPEAEQQGSEQEGGEQEGGQQQGEAQQQAPQGGDSSGGGGGGDGTPVTMPALGESVTEGTITRWLKQVGDRVEVDEPLLEVSTDKVDTEIPSPVAGFLVSIAVGEDETVEVGGQLAVVGDSADGGQGEQAPEQQPAQEEQQPTQQEQPSEPEQAQQEQPAEQQEQPAPQQAAPAAQPQQAEPAQQAAPAAQQQAPQQQQAAPAPQPQQATPAAQEQDVPAQQQRPASESAEGSAYVTPLVRKLASEHGVDLSGLSGTGVGGRIRKQDVLAAAEQQRKQPAPQQTAAAAADQPAAGAPKPAEESPLRGTTEKMSRLRKVIAARMVESLQTSAQLTTVVEVDVTKIARLRNRAKGDFETREGVRLSFLPFFAKATVEALKSHPRVNSSVNGEEIVYHGAEHLGVAVDTERGLLVPVVKDAGDLNIAGLARKIADLAERTRSNKITPDELGGGTFTLTNTGSVGALFDTPIINQPQVGILGTGSVVKRAVVVDDEDLGETIAVRSMIYLALSYDHRIVDGADAMRFLATIKARLEEGRFESDLGL
jgi:2-oxoglutarate dehydrogenase E2 component (dihydrolipoamide succinyltransferase)